jgi:hypothetical protein
LGAENNLPKTRRQNITKLMAKIAQKSPKRAPSGVVFGPKTPTEPESAD